jgi:hypothetical protein
MRCALMLESRPFWTVRCDRCNANAFETDDITAYSDAKSAVEVLRDSDWLLTEDGKHYCEDCTVWSDVQDERVAKP